VNPYQFEKRRRKKIVLVAMTRAKELLYLVADVSYKSKFIAEMEVESKILKSKNVRSVFTADLVKRSGVKNGSAWAFYGCSNFMYGSDYREWV
jgi:DNA helicase-4